jgi:hypothetical protein
MLSRHDYFRYKRISKIKKVIRVSKVFLFLFVILISILMVYNFDLDFKQFFGSNEMVNTEISLQGPDCSNLPFQDTAICLNDYVRAIYSYNITDDSLTLTLEDLIKRGGDCKDWTDFYESYMNYYGYENTQRVKVFVDKEGDISNYHVFLIASHSSGYCHMDLTDLECYQYVNSAGEVKE